MKQSMVHQSLEDLERAGEICDEFLPTLEIFSPTSHPQLDISMHQLGQLITDFVKYWQTF